MTKKKDLLLIFARNPRPGKAKKRLAAKIGEKAALEIYRILLDHTEDITSETDCDKIVYFTESASEDEAFKSPAFRKELQYGEGLGQKMENAFSKGFSEGYSKVVIIGTDLFELQKDDLQKAFRELDKHDYILGPAKDGGYYLLGMKKLNPSVFRNKTWSTATVLPETLADLAGEKVFLLEEKNDIDVYDDLKDVPVFEEYLKVP